MKILSANDINGDIVNLKVSQKNHITDKINPQDKNGSKVQSFSDLFKTMMNDVNNQEINANKLANQMVINPDSVDIHDVEIAAEKAQMSILFTKGIVDRVIRSYREIVHMQ